MPRYVAFLRAINVGGHVVKMGRLRELFEAFGARDVETFIASGNVVFDTTARSRDALETRLERHLEAALGYAVATFVRTPAELAAITAFRPADATRSVFESRGLYVGFLKSAPPASSRAKLLAFGSDVNAFYFDAREVYWSCATRMTDSGFSGGQIERALGMPMTMRNITTVRRLADRYGPS